jgi:polygalacturonase
METEFGIALSNNHPTHQIMATPSRSACLKHFRWLPVLVSGAMLVCSSAHLAAATGTGTTIVEDLESAEAKEAARVAAAAWARVPEVLARIHPPNFPAKDFPITDYKAVGDGKTDCTESFRAAIENCHLEGGGRVLVPAGTYLTGPIHLKSRVNLHLVKGATILFTTNKSAYLPVVFTRFECTEVMSYSPPIYALGQTDIAITGEGTLDGQGSAWHAWLGQWGADVRLSVEMGDKDVPVAERVFGEGHKLRPNFIQPVRCKNVLIEGVKVINSPMWTLNPVYCTNVIIRGVTVETKGPNTDGCDPDSCKDVWIKDCVFNNGDDCIAIKSGRDHDGRRVNIPSENIVIQDCRFAAGHGGVTMGSETAGGVRNVFAERCHFDSPNLDMAMRFKTNPARGGFVEDIYIRDCTVKTAKFGIHMTLRYGSGGRRDGDHPPVMRNIDIRNSTFGTLTKGPIFVEGYSASNLITDVTIANCTFEPSKKSYAITNAAQVVLIGVKGIAR